MDDTSNSNEEGGTSQKVPRHVQKIVDAVTDIARPIAATRGADIDRIVFRDMGKRALLQVFLDKPDGVTVDDCASVSRELSANLDVFDVVPKAYVLEVSSPGLDRPLDGEADFKRFAGRPASITCRRAVDGGSKVTGRLLGVEEGAVVVQVKDGRHVRVPLEWVARARLEVE